MNAAVVRPDSLSLSLSLSPPLSLFLFFYLKEREEMKRGNAHKGAFMWQHKEHVSNALCST